VARDAGGFRDVGLDRSLTGEVVEGKVEEHDVGRCIAKWKSRSITLDRTEVVRTSLGYRAAHHLMVDVDAEPERSRLAPEPLINATTADADDEDNRIVHIARERLEYLDGSQLHHAVVAAEPVCWSQPINADRVAGLVKVMLAVESVSRRDQSL